MSQPNILDKIVAQTKEDVKKRFRERSLASFEDEALFHQRPSLSLIEAMKKEASGIVRVIAEVKKASPSKGLIRQDFNALDHAYSYQENGAAAISCLTDEPFFQGSLAYLKTIAENVNVPLLRKDFIIDPFQVAEAKAFGANAILLIAAICSASQLAELHDTATEYGLECLVELYDESEMEKLDLQKMHLIGVNNRDLRTFQVDLHRGVAMLKSLPKETIKVSESGLSSHADLQYLYENHIHGALIGEYFMRQTDPGVALKTMLNQ